MSGLDGLVRSRTMAAARTFGSSSAALVFALCASTVSAHAQAFTVNSTGDGDDGVCGPAHCTLREAINAANGAPGEALIVFDIPGPGPHTIRPTSALPGILAPTHIDGTSEPDFAGTPVVELDGSLAGIANGLDVGASNSTVSGLVVNRFRLHGIRIRFGSGASGTIIEGCYLGTDVTGTLALGNASGIAIESGSGHRVGGTAASQRNVLSGNGHGILLGSDTRDNRVFGNYIGTNATGDAAVPNNWGIWVNGADNVIGGEEAGEGNVISGNEQEGIVTNTGASSGNFVLGNLIGTDRSGSVAIPNLVTGVLVSGPGDTGNTIGGSNPGARNIISGNGVGVRLEDVSGTRVIGNYIGTDQTGTMAVPNRTGVLLHAPRNTIGGFTPGFGNLISGNTVEGLRFWMEEASGNVAQGNLIGVDVTGSANLGNGGPGILLEDGASDNLIGGEDAGAGNTIAYNGAQGIVMLPDGGTGNLLRSNSIFENGGLGIELLGEDESDINDEGDVDTGPNELQNHPLVMAVPTQGAILAKALLHRSLPNEPFTFEFFENESCDPSGYGEGQTPLFTVMQTSAADGDASISGVTSGVTHLTGTVTDGSGNTSEFSDCVPLTEFDMDVSPATRTVAAGSTATYAITLSNVGGPFNDAVELECSGNPAGTTCTFLEPELIPGPGDISTEMTVSTLGLLGASSMSIPWSPPPRIWLALVGLAGLALVGRWTVLSGRPKGAPASTRRALTMALAVAAVTLLAPAGCGDDPSGPPSPPPSGTYTLVITGTWETVSHSVNATLVVN